MWRLKQLMPNSKDQGGLEGKTVEVGSLKLQVRSTIAEGGFSCVYLARDSSQQGKQYALKHIICNDGESLDLVKKEVAVMRNLRGHPNVVSLQAQTVYDLGRTKECFLVLEFCEKSLVNVLESRGAAYFDEKQILVIFRDICNAVYAMHCQSPPIAHRDLKAENVLMGADGVWKLCDFGSTSTNHKRFEKPEEMGIEEDIIRKHTTPAYRAPEMWDLYTRDLISEKVDIWALGCLLYRIAYLKSAFDGESKLQILNGNYRIPELPRYSSSLTDLIKDMLSAAPEARPDILQIWRRVNELLPSDLRKSNPDRPSSVAASEVSAPTDAREHGTPPPTRRAPLPSRSPPPPPPLSSKEQDRSSPVAQSDSKAVEGCNSGSPVGAFWSTQYAQESVVVAEKGPVFDKDPGFESAFKPRSHSPDTHPKEVNSNTSPPKGHSSKIAPHSKRSVMSHFTKKVHGSLQPTSGQGYGEINSDMHHMRFSSEDTVEGGESLSKVSPMKTIASESDGPFRDDSFNAFVADFDYSKVTSGSSSCARENFQSVDKLKEELDKVRREKAEITSKYEKLTAICRSQRQEIQELKHALNTGTVQSFPAINKEQRQRPKSGNLPTGSQQLDNIDGSIWELQENMSSSELPTQASDTKGWQAFPESQPTQLSKSPPSSARILSGVSTGGHATLDDVGTASNGYLRQQHGTGGNNVSTGDSWGFVQDSFTSTNDNPRTSKPSGQACAQDESRDNSPAHISNSSKSESWSSRSLTKTQPAGWAGF